MWLLQKIICPCDRDLLVFTKWHNKQDYLIYQMLQCTRFMICTSAFASPIFFVISHVLHNLLISYLAIHFSFEIWDLIAKTGYCQNVSFFFGYAAMSWQYYRYQIPIYTMIVHTTTASKNILKSYARYFYINIHLYTFKILSKPYIG